MGSSRAFAPSICCRCSGRGRRHHVCVGRLGPRRKHRRREVGVVEGVRTHVRGGGRGYVCTMRRSSNIMRNWRSAVIRGMPCCRGTRLSWLVVEIGLSLLRGTLLRNECSLGGRVVRYRALSVPERPLRDCALRSDLRVSQRKSVLSNAPLHLWPTPPVSVLGSVLCAINFRHCRGPNAPCDPCHCFTRAVSAI